MGVQARHRPHHQQAEQVREDYQPREFSQLLQATARGTREGDLIRLAIATGCRADEIATIPTEQVKEDGSGFYLTEGKTKNAARFIPVVGGARALLQARSVAHRASGRAFPRMAHQTGHREGCGGLPVVRALPSQGAREGDRRASCASLDQAHLEDRGEESRGQRSSHQRSGRLGGAAYVKFGLRPRLA